MLNDHSKTLHWFGQSIKKKVTKQHGVDHGWYREKVLSIYGAGTFISMSPKSFSLLCSFVHMELCYNAIVEGLRERTEHLDIFLFFSAHHLMVFYFRCSVYWWKGIVRF